MPIDNPLFSVVIPTYNRAERLRIALQSLSSQTFKNLEVLVCDDGSTDHTKEIVESFREKLDLTYIWEENWGGPARPRNNGIKAAKGEWICFLDSDDWWYPEKLEKCLPYLDHYDLIYHDMEMYDTNQKIIGKLKSRNLLKDAFNDLLLNGNFISNSSVIVRKQILVELGGISENRSLIAIEDFDMWLKIAHKGYKLFWLSAKLGGYLTHEMNLTSSQLTIIEKERNLLEIYKESLNRKIFNKIWTRYSYSWGRRILLSNIEISKSKDFFLEGATSPILMIKIKSIISLITLYLREK